MTFRRTRKFYLLASFTFVVILFFFSHWKSYKILVQNTHKPRNRLLVQDSEQLDERSNLEAQRNDSKCRSESGVQTSAHCVNEGDNENIVASYYSLMTHLLIRISAVMVDYYTFNIYN